jgi:hypothetical protein
MISRCRILLPPPNRELMLLLLDLEQTIRQEKLFDKKNYTRIKLWLMTTIVTSTSQVFSKP